MYSKKFIDNLADFICGDNNQLYPIYRSSWYLTGFFQNINIDVTHDGSTRKHWVLSILNELSDENIGLVIKTLVSPKFYSMQNKQLELAIDTMNSLLLYENKKIEFDKLEPNIIEYQTTIDDILSTTDNADFSPINKSKTYDVFISHASEDKEEFVRPLAKELANNGINIFYDEDSIKIGDSILLSIDNALAQSKFIILVLSESFIKKKWTTYEYEGATVQSILGNAKIIPIWHKVSKDEILKYSPTLMNKKALDTVTYSIDEISQEIVEIILKPSQDTDGLSSSNVMSSIMDRQNSVMKQNDIDNKKQKLKNIIINSFEKGYEKTYDEEFERIEQQSQECLERKLLGIEWTTQQALIMPNLSPISIGMEDSNSLRLKTWDNICIFINQEANPVERMCVYDILSEIEFYINKPKISRYVWVPKEENNLEDIKIGSRPLFFII